MRLYGGEKYRERERCNSKLNTMNSKKTGLVLSGGGFRGVAHAGVIKYLMEIGIEITHVAGTSAGAVVGALFAAGMDGDEILKVLSGTRLFTRRNLAFRWSGLLNPERIVEPLIPLFAVDDFDALKKRLFVTRTNLETGAGEVVSTGSVLEAVKCSAALPMLFAPVECNGGLYIDGGLTNNFPADVLRELCDHVIGVSVNPSHPHTRKDLGSLFNLLDQVVAISVSQNSTPRYKDCDVLIVPEALRGHSLLDVEHAAEMFEIGYRAAEEERDRLLPLLL